MEINSYINVEISGGASERNAQRITDNLNAIDKENQKVQKSTKQSTDEFEQFSKRGVDSTDRVNESMLKLGKNVVALAASYATFSTVKDAINTFAEFNQSMAQVKAVSNATSEEFVALSATARELGATTEFSGSQAAQGLKFLAMAGFDAEKAIKALPSTLDLATAATMGLADSADIVSNIMSAFGIQAENTSRVTDVLAAISSKANTDVYQLGQGMKFVGPVAQALGIDIGDTAAAMGVLSDAGIQGGMAGTSLRRVISSLIGPTGGAKDAIESLGLTLEEVNPNTNSLADVVQKLTDAGIGAEEAFEIFGDRGGPAFLALTENTPRLQELTEAMKNVEGETLRMATTMRDTLVGDIYNLESALEELQLTIVDSFDEELRTGMRVFNEMILDLVDNLDVVGNAAEALAVVLAGRVIANLSASAMATLNATNVSMAHGRALIENAALSGKAALAEQVKAAATVQSMQTVIAQIGVERNLELVRLQAQITDKGRELSMARLIEIRRAEIAMTAQLTTAERALAASTAQATAAKAAHTATIAQYGATATLAAGATRALSGALALIGGPVGLAVIAGYAIYTLSSRQKELTENMEVFAGTLARAQSGLNSFNSTSRDYEEIIRRTNSVISLNRAEIDAATQIYGANSEQVRILNSQLNQNLNTVREATDSLATFNSEVAKGTEGTDQFVGPLNSMAIAFREASSATDEMSDSIKEVIDNLRLEIDQLSQTESEIQVYNLTKKLGIDINSAAGQEIKLLVEEYHREKKSIEDAEEAQKEFTKTTEENTKAQNENREKTASIIRELNNQQISLRLSTRDQVLFNAELAALARGEGPEAIAKILELTAANYDLSAAQKEAADDAANLAKESEKAAEAAQKSWERTHEYMTTSLLDIWENGDDAFDNIAKSFESMVKRMIAEWAASGLMKLFGLGGGTFNFPGITIGGAPGAAGSAGNIISGAGSLASIASGIGQFIGGASGTAVGAGSVLAGPPTAAAAAGSGMASAITGAINAIPGWGWALGGAAILAKALEKEPTYSSNAGFLIRDVAGVSQERKFDVDPFESGFKPVGFARREDKTAATAVIETFRQYDAALTDIAKSIGLNYKMSDMSFGGFSETGQGGGLFFGQAAEEGKVTSSGIESQISQYISQWITALGGQISEEAKNAVLSAGSPDEMIKKASEIAEKAKKQIEENAISDLVTEAMEEAGESLSDIEIARKKASLQIQAAYKSGLSDIDAVKGAYEAFQKYSERGLTVQDVARFTGETIEIVQSVIDAGEQLEISQGTARAAQKKAGIEIEEKLSSLEEAKKRASLSILRSYESGLSEIDSAINAFNSYKQYASRGLTVDDISKYTGESISVITGVLDVGAAMERDSNAALAAQSEAGAKIEQNLSAMEIAKKQASLSILKAYESGLSEIDAAKRAFESFSQFAERGLTTTDVSRFTGATISEINNVLSVGGGEQLSNEPFTTMKEGMTLFTENYKKILRGDYSGNDPLITLDPAASSGMGYDVKRPANQDLITLDPSITDATEYYVPRYAKGGIHEGGLAIVGENGPELVELGKSRVYNSQETKKIINDSDAMSASEMKALVAEMRNIALYTKKTSDLLVRVTRDGESLQTTVVS